jgi:phage replication O-like protein O
MNGKPEVKDGFTRIANELLDAILNFSFSKREMKILLYVIRYSYGYQDKFVQDGLNQQAMIAKKTGLDKGDVHRTVQSLIKKNVIKIDDGKIFLNKYYLEWKVGKIPTSKKLVKYQQKVGKIPTPSWQNTNKKLVKYQLAPSNNPDENSTDSVPKEKRKYIKKKENMQNLDSLVLKDLKDVKEQDVAAVFELFSKEMNFKASVGYRVTNRRYVVLLLQDYTPEQIIQAVRIGKKEYEAEKKDPSKFITLKSLPNNIGRWLAKVERAPGKSTKEEEKEVEEVYRYFCRKGAEVSENVKRNLSKLLNPYIANQQYYSVLHFIKEYGGVEQAKRAIDSLITPDVQIFSDLMTQRKEMIK